MNNKRRSAFFRRSQGINYDLSSESGWIHCYSLAKRFPAYSGPCLTISRDSDAAPLDVYFDSGGLVDLAAINTHCAGTTGRVVKWYDQYGSGNDLIGTGALPTIYVSGVSEYNIKTNGNSGFEFTSDFDVLRDFSYIVNNRATSIATITNLTRRGGGNRGVGLTGSGSNRLGLTYYGVADYSSLNTASGVLSFVPVKYSCWFHDYNANFAASFYSEGVSSFTDLGSISIGTMLTTVIPTRLAVVYNTTGTITGYTNTTIRELFFFSTDQRNNTNIFDKKLTL